MLDKQAAKRFATEIERILLRGQYDPGNWQQSAFAGLVENVETLAIHRGLQRWEP